MLILIYILLEHDCHDVKSAKTGPAVILQR